MQHSGAVNKRRVRACSNRIFYVVWSFCSATTYRPLIQNNVGCDLKSNVQKIGTCDFNPSVWFNVLLNHELKKIS